MLIQLCKCRLASECRAANANLEVPIKLCMDWNEEGFLAVSMKVDTHLHLAGVW